MVNSDVPLTMLIFRAEPTSDSRAKLYGFWYFAKLELPGKREDVLLHLTAELCKQVYVTGTRTQIAEILMIAGKLNREEWDPRVLDVQ